MASRAVLRTPAPTEPGVIYLHCVPTLQGFRKKYFLKLNVMTFSASPRASWSRDTAGFSPILVVLVTAGLMLIMISITSTLALGSRTRTADEYQSYRSLQAAESALDSFTVRARLKNALPSFTCSSTGTGTSCQSQVQAWLAANNLETISTPTGDVRVEVINTTPDNGKLSGFDVRAAANVQGSTTRVVQSYVFTSSNKRWLPRLPAAVTSFPSMDVKGSATVVGSYASNFPKFLTVPGTLNAASTQTLQAGTMTTIPVTGLEGLAAGDYVRLPGTYSGGTGDVTARVESVGTAGITVTPLAPLPSTLPVSMSTGAQPVRRVVGGVVTATNSTLRVTDPELYLPRDAVQIESGGKVYTGQLGTLDTTTGTWTVTWSGGKAPPTTNLEGSSLQRQVLGASTHGSLDGSGSVSPGYEMNAASDRIALPTSSGLFQQVFGMDKSTLLAGVPTINASQLPDNMSGLVVIEGDANLNSEKLCGSGVLIVKGSLNINQNKNACPGGFQGLIYVSGGASVHGNLEVMGAIVVEGQLSFDDPTLNTSGSTSLAGNGRKVTFDVPSLVNAMAQLPASRLSSVAGTWRQQ